MTSTVSTAQIQAVLDDYNVRLTGTDVDINGPAPTNIPQAPEVPNPPSWPTNYHDVPPYRPADVDRDLATRSDGVNPAERVFIFVMLHGVWLNASVSYAWRKTGGRLNPNIFRYKIGGEW